jgi:hypothetical protein
VVVRREAVDAERRVALGHLLGLDLVPIGSRPEFSARASGMASNASAKPRNAYCSMVLI